MLLRCHKQRSFIQFK